MEEDSVPPTVTELLAAWGAGNKAALERLAPLIDNELRRIASRYLRRERPNHTLQPTALVHEVYVRVLDRTQVSYKNRAHFLAICAQIMRQIVVDYARRHRAIKRGRGLDALPLEEALIFAPERGAHYLALDEALRRLSQFEPRKSKVVELRFFGGLTNEEIAQVLDISVNTVLRDWAFTRAWIKRELASER